MYYNSKQTPMPEAYVALQKNRLPQKDGRVYLKNNTEFQLELFNPRSQRVGVEIKINGSLISKSLLVLKPAERVFLDRFLDNNKKLLFSTYEVEKGNEIVERAIAENGVIEIKFFNEDVPISNRGWSVGDYVVTLGQPTILGGPKSPYDPIITDGPPSNAPYWYTTTNGPTLNMMEINSLSSDSSGNVNYFSSNLDSLNIDSGNKELSKDMKETGRVEQGSKSNQELHEVDVNFCISEFHTVKLQILPESVKPAEVKIRSYCTECGTKAKSSWKYCPTCGAKV